MSELQDDKKDQIKRRNTLQDADAPLVDQMPKRLLAKAKEMELGLRAQKVWSRGNADRSVWLERQQVYLSDWDEFLEATADGPFENASNLHLPMPFVVVKTYHARMLQALIGDDFRFPAKARREDSMVREQMISDTMRYALKEWCNQHQGIEEVLDEWIWTWCSSGVGILKWRWESIFQRYLDVQPTLTVRTETRILEDGREIEEPVTEINDQEIEMTKEVFSGPVAENVNPEDFLLVGGKGDPEKADVVQHRVWMTASELWTLVDRKVFDSEAVQEILNGGPDTISGGIATDIKQQRAQNAGKAGVDTAPDFDRYEILESYWNLDIDGSGINSQIVTWSHQRSAIELRATYLHRISPDGKKPFIKADFFKRKDQDFGIGLAEILHPLSVELDSFHNQAVDYGTISAMPFGFVRASSSLDPEDIKLAPGTLIAVDNPQSDVFFPNIGPRQGFGLQFEQSIQGMIERLTGISDLNLGVLSGSQGATRTATGTRALIGEANANLDVHLKRLTRAWKRSLEYLFHMLQKRMPEGMSFRITGDDGENYWHQVRDRTDLIGDFDFEISGNSANSNPSVRDAVSQELLALSSNPLAIQLGIVTPANFYEALKNRMLSMQVKDFNRYFTKPQGQSVQLSPEEEFNRVIRGLNVQVTPEMDHEGYLSHWEFLKTNDNLLGQFDEQQVLLAQAQADSHTRMMQALREMQAQAANARQVQLNQSLAQPGQGPLTGVGLGSQGAQSGPNTLPTAEELNF